MPLPRAPRALAAVVTAAAVALAGAALPSPAQAADGDSPDAPVVLSPTDGAQLSGTITIRAAWTTNPYPYPTKVGVVTHQYRADGTYATYNVVHSDQVNGVEARWTPPAPGRWGVQAFRCDARVVCMSSSVERDRSKEVFFTYGTTTAPTAAPTTPAPTTAAPTTAAPTTAAPTTAAPTTAPPITAAPTTAAPTTPAPTTAAPTTAAPTTAAPTTAAPTTAAPTTAAPTTAPPITAAPTTAAPTTSATTSSPTPSPTPSQAPSPTSTPPPVTVSAPHEVVRGSEVVVTGRAAPGARVDVHLLREGLSRPDLAGGLVAGPDGTWRTSYTADTDRTVWATSDGVHSAEVAVRAVGTTLGRLGLVRTGTTVQIGGLARPGSAVQLWARDSGTTTPTLRLTVTTGPDGRWSAPYAPTRDQVVHVLSEEGRSAPQLLQIALATLTGPATALKGSVVTLTGRARPGAVVTVAFRRTGTTTFVVRRTLRADGTGRFRTTWTADVSQAWFAQADGVRSAVGSTTVRVPAPGSACSSTAPLFSYADSARCLYRAFVTGDRAMANRYATLSVAATIMSWRDPSYPHSWQWQGCHRNELVPTSSGVSCYYLDGATADFHGVWIEMGLGRDLRVHGLETVG